MSPPHTLTRTSSGAVPRRSRSMVRVMREVWAVLVEPAGVAFDPVVTSAVPPVGPPPPGFGSVDTPLSPPPAMSAPRPTPCCSYVKRRV
jgi:hypothetical protein